jgi:hypothetical protein
VRLPGINGDFLVRAEYIRLYNFVESVYATREEGTKPPIVVITGQPGIGKTIWIYYALRRRLAQRLPSILYVGGGIYYRIVQSGVYIHKGTKDFWRKAPEPLWCFVDSAYAPDGPPISLASVGSRSILVVYVTSPTSRRWAKLHQISTQHRAIMDPWTWEEMEHA